VSSAQTPEIPLTDDEFDELADLLDEHSSFDSDAVVGMFHAVAIAPSFVPPSIWLRRVLPEDSTDLDGETFQHFVRLLLRLYNEIVSLLENNRSMIPAAEDMDACESFAAGYAEGAALEPEWIGNDARWTFASHVAYLGDRLDLVPEPTRVKIETMLPEPKKLLCRELGGIVRAARESFLKVRRPETAPLASQTRTETPRVGRNAPCPCGSGKKYKRCCGSQTSRAPS
jgi:uncharacterized protein